MNRFQSAIQAAARATTNAFSWVTGKAGMGLALVSVYLQDLLWLIESKFRDLIQLGYKQNAAAYACMKLLATSVPEPPLVAHLRTPDGDAGAVLAWSHPLRRLIRQPNVLMTEYERWELVTLHVGAVGRSVWWKERDHVGRLIAEWPLRPDRVGPIYSGPDDRDSAGGVIVGWSYQVPGKAEYVAIPWRDAIVYNLPDPMGESGGIVEGLGPLQVLASEIGADNEATRYVGSLLANDARPGTVIKIKGKITSKEDAYLLKEAFRQEYSGNRRGLPGIIDGDSEIQSVGFNLKDLEFPSLRRISESRICAAFGVPAILVGLLVGLEAGIRATIAEQREFFAETTLANYWRRFSDQYTLDVASEFGTDLVCAFDLTEVKALVGQAKTRLDGVRDGYINKAITKNEYRVELGFPERVDGDCYIDGIAPGGGTGIEEPAGAEVGVADAEDLAPPTVLVPNGHATPAETAALVPVS